MAAGYTTRKLYVYDLHVRGAESYQGLFTYLAQLPPSGREARVGEMVVSIRVRKRSSKLYSVVAYEGDPEAKQLVLNRKTARTTTQAQRRSRMIVAATHALFDVKRRKVVIEFNQRGARFDDMAEAMEALAQRKWSAATVELNPTPNQGFLHELARFSRVRVVTLKLARPNVSWTDFNNSLMDEAQDSNAGIAEVGMFAARGRSLSKTKGILAALKQFLSGGLSPLKSAHIEGTRAGEEEAATLSLARHQLNQRVSVRKNDSGLVDPTDIDEKMEQFLSDGVQGHTPTDD